MNIEKVVKLAGRDDRTLAYFSNRWAKKKKMSDPVSLLLRLHALNTLFVLGMVGAFIVAVGGYIGYKATGSRTVMVRDISWVIAFVMWTFGVASWVTTRMDKFHEANQFLEALTLLEGLTEGFEKIEIDNMDPLRDPAERLLRSRAAESKRLETKGWRKKEHKRARAYFERGVFLLSGLLTITEDDDGFYFGSNQ